MEQTPHTDIAAETKAIIGLFQIGIQSIIMIQIIKIEGHSKAK